MTHRHIVTSPFQNITDKPTSHRSAQAYIYASMIQEANRADIVDVNVGGRIKDFSKYTVVWVYHGNDFQGGLNLYGGLEGFDGTNVLALSKVNPLKVVSLGIPMPDYATLIRGRLQKAKNPRPEWLEVNLEALDQMVHTPYIKHPNAYFSSKAVLGDSHAISLYRPGWIVESIPFKTLYGALSIGLDKLIKERAGIPKPLKEVELYFGNIDIRHHLCRQPDRVAAVNLLVDKYFRQAEEIQAPKVKIYEPLPIEDESRKLPKTGYYEGTPFYGSWAERNYVRDLFITKAKELSSERVEFVQWTEYLKNSRGQLDFEKMEKPQSVHLARSAYPFWTGIPQPNYFEEFS